MRIFIPSAVLIVCGQDVVGMSSKKRLLEVRSEKVSRRMAGRNWKRQLWCLWQCGYFWASDGM